MSLQLYDKRKLGSCCVVPGCSFRSGTNKLSEIRIFRFPKNNERRAAWAQAIRRETWQPSNSSKICSRHFVEGKPSQDHTHPDWVPSVFPFTPVLDTANVQKISRYNVLLKRKRSLNTENSSDDSSTNTCNVVDDVSVCEEPKLVDSSTITDFTGEHYDELAATNAFLKKRVQILESQVKGYLVKSKELAIVNETLRNALASRRIDVLKSDKRQKTINR